MKYTSRLTTIIAGLAFTTAGISLWWDDLYSDPPLFKAAWFGNDLVTLVAAPALWITHHYYKDGHQTAHLLWLGILQYILYSYAFYVFGAAYNSLFLLYVTLFALALYTLVLALMQLAATTPKMILRRPVQKVIAIFLFLVAVPLAGVELSQLYVSVVSHRSPAIPPLVVALDFSLVVPLAILAGVLLWNGRTWGIILGMMVLTKSFLYGAVLLLGVIRIVRTGVGDADPLIAFYAFIMVGGLAFTGLLIYSIDTSHQPASP